MPRIGMKPIRRKALIEAAIATIGECGSLDVTVSQIAHRAGVSSALAHHYFGGKDQLIADTMRYLLSELGTGVRVRLAGLENGRARLSAIVAANFADDQFHATTIAAWLTFYVKAQSAPEVRRLLRVYSHRLRSNLTDALARLVGRAAAGPIAEGAAAMIDGLYLHQALREERPDPQAAIRMIENYLDTQIAAADDALKAN
ncbi:MAG: transcriptional regulator BetI [Hyphomicrobiales bacterium]|nr:transcriptional regulator BetI [Hyphomicrobiales bacterium]